MYSLCSAYPLALNLELGAYHMLEAMKPNNLPLIDFMEECSLLYAFECMNKHGSLPHYDVGEQGNKQHDFQIDFQLDQEIKRF